MDWLALEVRNTVPIHEEVVSESSQCPALARVAGTTDDDNPKSQHSKVGNTI